MSASFQLGPAKKRLARQKNGSSPPAVPGSPRSGARRLAAAQRRDRRGRLAAGRKAGQKRCGGDGDGPDSLFEGGLGGGDGARIPLTLRTYWPRRGLDLGLGGGGSRPRSTVMLRHIAGTLPARSSLAAAQTKALRAPILTRWTGCPQPGQASPGRPYTLWSSW